MAPGPALGEKDQYVIKEENQAVKKQSMLRACTHEEIQFFCYGTLTDWPASSLPLANQASAC